MGGIYGCGYQVGVVRMYVLLVGVVVRRYIYIYICDRTCRNQPYGAHFRNVYFHTVT